MNFPILRQIHTNTTIGSPINNSGQAERVEFLDQEFPPGPARRFTPYQRMVTTGMAQVRKKVMISCPSDSALWFTWVENEPEYLVEAVSGEGQ